MREVTNLCGVIPTPDDTLFVTRRDMCGKVGYEIKWVENAIIRAVCGMSVMCSVPFSRALKVTASHQGRLSRTSTSISWATSCPVPALFVRRNRSSLSPDFAGGEDNGMRYRWKAASSSA